MPIACVQLACYGTLPIAAGILYGVIKPAGVTIVLHAAWRIGARALKHPLLWWIAAAAFIAIFAFGVAFPLIVVSAGSSARSAHGMRLTHRLVLERTPSYGGGDADSFLAIRAALVQKCQR